MSDRGVEDVDLLVIGGGKAGKSLAMNRAKAGGKVAMVERDKIGGTCINVACIPTKALVGSSRTVLKASHADVMGVELDGEATVSVDGLRQHKSSVVDGMVAAHKKMFADSGMDFILGTARFIAPRTVEVKTRDETIRLLQGTDVVINTGTMPAIPDLPGITESRPWTSETILELERLPQRLIVLGGGYVGCEFASMFAIFGARVTLLQGPDQLLPREDLDIAAEVANILADQGVDLRLGVRAKTVHREGRNGDVVVVLEDGSEVRGEQLLAATGRAPVTTDLGLASAGVDLTTVGSSTWTSTCAPQLTMYGQPVTSPAVRSSPTLRGTTSASSRQTWTTVRRSPEVGSCRTPVFVTPELARIGMTEAQARALGRNVAICKIPVSAIPRARTLHDTTGTWKAVVDADTDLILGAALLGHNAGEVISTLQMAMLGELPYQQVRDAPLTHPTMGEGLNLIFDALDDQ